MQRSSLLFLLGSLLTLILAVSGSPALAATPDFTLATTNVTMSSSDANGNGSTAFTLTSVNGYTGTITVACIPPNPPAGVKVPNCGGGAIARAYTLTANGVATGAMDLDNSPVPEPVVHWQPGGSLRKATGIAMAGLLLFGFGIRRRAARWLTLLLLAAGTLAGISACGASNSVVTPGTYAYALRATDINTSASVTTPFSVTVP
jgi:hypothetical protein